MKCLIIAAGSGKRLLAKGKSKPLIPLLGLPLIERVILTAERAGLTDFYVVTGHNGEKVRGFLDSLSRQRNLRITHIENPEWEKNNGISVLKARDHLKENFILLMCDHIFEESILLKLKNETVSDSEVMLAVDFNTETNELVDVNDATKVVVKDLMILDIGKDISAYNAFDTGIFLCSSAIFSAIEESSHMGDSSISGGMKVLARKSTARVFDVGHAFWIDVDDENALKKAEDRLLSALKKNSDGPVSRYLNRPVSLRITKPLLKTSITPNSVSFFSFILSMLGAFFFFLGGYLNLVIGAVLAQVSSVVDGCDGEIARLKFQVSEFGGWFDAVLDRYADAFLLFGLTWHVYSVDNRFWILFIGFMAVIGSFMNSYTADKYDSLMKKKLASKRGYFRIGRDVRVFIIFICALLNQPFLGLLFLAVLMNMENMRRVALLYKNA